MSLDIFTCPHCNGGGWRGNEDGRLVACYFEPRQEAETVEVPPLTEEMVIARMEARR
jgi:hypothetical protein